MARLPTDAFEQYVALGTSRTYVALASKLGVSKRSVVRRATRDGWQARLQRIAATAAEKFDEKAANETAAVNDRHLRVVRAIQHKALAALQSLPLNSGLDAVRALEISIKAERLVLGTDDGKQEPTVIHVLTGVSQPLPPRFGES